MNRWEIPSEKRLYAINSHGKSWSMGDQTWNDCHPLVNIASWWPKPISLKVLRKQAVNRWAAQRELSSGSAGPPFICGQRGPFDLTGPLQIDWKVTVCGSLWQCFWQIFWQQIKTNPKYKTKMQSQIEPKNTYAMNRMLLLAQDFCREVGYSFKLQKIHFLTLY